LCLKQYRVDGDVPAFSAKFARSAALAVLGAASTPDRAADKTSVPSTGTIRSDLSGLPWGQSCSSGGLGSNKSWQKPEKSSNLHFQKRIGKRELRRLIGSDSADDFLRLYNDIGNSFIWYRDYPLG
jgi:hypothetical protein